MKKTENTQNRDDIINIWHEIKKYIYMAHIYHVCSLRLEGVC